MAMVEAERVQYPRDVCADHEFGSDWPCLGCGK